MPIDIKLTNESSGEVTDHDLLIENHDLVLISDEGQLSQYIRIRLWFFYKEWYLDTSRGIRFFEEVLGKQNINNLPRIESLFKEEILNIDGVNSILEFTLVLNRRERKMQINFKVDTDVGEINISQPLEVI